MENNYIMHPEFRTNNIALKNTISYICTVTILYSHGIWAVARITSTYIVYNYTQLYML